MQHAILCFYIFLAFFQDPWKDVYSERAWAQRDLWQHSEALIGALQLQAGGIVADIGCHEGYMSVKLSAAVGANGKIYAVDIATSKLDCLKSNLEKRGISNVIPVKGDYDDPHLPPGSLDAVIILDTYHEMKEHDRVLLHIWKALKPGGRLVICEPIAAQRRDLSREEQEDIHELALKFAVDDLERCGFIVRKKQDPFVDRTHQKGDKRWLLVAVK